MLTRLPPLRALQAFEATGRLETASAAAIDLGVTPGAITQHIHALEADVGVALFERQGRRLVLTSWGQIYLERIRAAFDNLRAAQDVLRRARLKSHIVMSAPPSLMIRWLRPLMIEWQRLHPEVTLRLVGEDKEPVFADEPVDFRLSYGKARLRYDHFTDLFVDSIVPVCSPGLLARRPIVTAADILRGPLIGIEWANPHQSPPSWSDWAEQFGLQPPDRPCELSFSLSSAAVDAAISDSGFVLGQTSIIADDLDRGRLVIASDNRMTFPEPYALAWNPASLDLPFILEFRDFIVRAAGSLRMAPCVR